MYCSNQNCSMNYKSFIIIVLLFMICFSTDIFSAVTIDYSPASSKIYIGSPSIVIDYNGCYVASHDYFGPGISQDTTVVFRSDDRGLTWHKISTIKGQWWSTLFLHNNQLYLLGTDKDNGKVVIRRSIDGGSSWTSPDNSTTGLLLSDGRYGCAPGAVVVSDGRIWRAMEKLLKNENKKHDKKTDYEPFMMSAPINSNLLDANNWSISNVIFGNAAWLGGKFRGWLEGNAVESPSGEMLDILRVRYLIGTEKAALVHISQDGRVANFNESHDFIDFPGGSKKFTIRFDPVSHQYWSLVNLIPPQASERHDHIRNTLVLASSGDLHTWNIHSIIMHHPDTKKHGFHYADWQFDGNDIIAAIRAANDDAHGGAHSFHDANYFLFQRITNFRTLNDYKDSSQLILNEKSGGFDLSEFSISDGNYSIQQLNNGNLAFSNRKYLLENIPQELAGRKYTQLPGGSPQDITIHINKEVTLEIATASIDQPGIDMNGWKQTSTQFSYGDAKHTQMILFERKANPGEEIHLPKGNWSGALLILPVSDVDLDLEER